MTDQATKIEEGIAFSGPALHSNRFFVNAWPNAVRIAFLENSDPANTPQFRSAVMLSLDDAVALQKLLGELIVKVAQKQGHGDVH